MEVTKELRHWRSRVDLWWSNIMRGHRAQQEQRSARVREQYVAYQERQRKLASGELALPKGWHQKPDDPPGYLRWWNGAEWTEHTQQSQQAAKTERRKQSGGLALAGGLTFLLGLLFWPLFLASFVIGIVLATQGRASDGVILMVLSVIGPILSIAGCAAVLTSGS